MKSVFSSIMASAAASLLTCGCITVHHHDGTAPTASAQQTRIIVQTQTPMLQPSDSTAVQPQATAPASASPSASAQPSGPVFTKKLSGYITQMTQDGIPMLVGEAPDTGIWIITKTEISLAPNLTTAEAEGMAEVKCKRDIAAYLEGNVTAQDQAILRSQQVAGIEHMEEFLTSVQQLDVNVLLRGVTPAGKQVADGKLTMFFYVTSRLANAAAELKKQLQQLPADVVRAIGFAQIAEGQFASAKSRATQAALRNAVEQVMGTMVIGQSQVMDNIRIKSKVISQTAGHIKEYRIVKEGRQDDCYQVILNAHIDQKSLLENYTSIIRSIGNPAIKVQAGNVELESLVMDFLAELGFNVTQQDEAAQFACQVQVTEIPLHTRASGDGLQVKLLLAFSDIATGRSLFRILNDPLLTTSYYGTPERIRSKAIEKCFRHLKAPLHEKLNRLMLDWVLNGREIRLYIKGGMRTPELIDLFDKVLSWVPCATVINKIVDKDNLDITCSYVGSMADFEYFLRDGLRRELAEKGALPKTEYMDYANLVLSF